MLPAYAGGTLMSTAVCNSCGVNGAGTRSNETVRRLQEAPVK